MSLITIAELKEHIETDLSDTALQRIIDSNDQIITARYGEATTETETQYFGLIKVSTEFFWLRRKASSITSVVETVGTIDTTLNADDYSLDNNKYILRRENDGTNQRQYWGDRVVVTYVPEDMSAKRTMALINLCKLDIVYNGLKSEATPDYKTTSADYKAERENILNELGGRWWA